MYYAGIRKDIPVSCNWGFCKVLPEGRRQRAAGRYAFLARGEATLWEVVASRRLRLARLYTSLRVLPLASTNALRSAGRIGEGGAPSPPSFGVKVINVEAWRGSGPDYFTHPMSGGVESDRLAAARRRLCGRAGRNPKRSVGAEQGEAAARRPLRGGLPSRSPKTRSARLPSGTGRSHTSTKLPPRPPTLVLTPAREPQKAQPHDRGPHDDLDQHERSPPRYGRLQCDAF